MTNAQRNVLLLTSGAAITYFLTQPSSVVAPVAKEIGTSTRPAFLGRVRTRDFVAELQAALAGQSSFVALKVTRTYAHSRDIHRSLLGFTSAATTVITYRAEYAFGFDLRRLKFEQLGSELIVTVDRPRLVATPAVVLLSHAVPTRGLLVDEEAALVELQQRIQPQVAQRAPLVAAEPAVMAEAGRSLAASLGQPLGRPGGAAPGVRVVYR